MKNTNINYNISANLLNLKDITSLTIQHHSVLIGIMLGDGGIYRTSLKNNTRFEMSFGFKYKDFAESIENLFSEYMSNPLKTQKIKGKDKIYINYRLKTKTLPLFNQYHDMFYRFDSDKHKFVKIIPINIIELLNPIVLAYLIMTDGNFDKTRKRIRIYTNSYKKEEVQNLSSAINTKFGIYTAVLHDRKDQWIITIGATQLHKLREIVSPHFNSSMLYRIGL